MGYKRDRGFLWICKRKTFEVWGVSRENFVYYLKELGFRYNNREKLDEMLYKVLSGKFWVIA
jgi:transposase